MQIVRKLWYEDRVYQLKIKLLNSPLPIWRRVEIKADISLALTHEVIQIVMGWHGVCSHLFCTKSGHMGDLPGEEYEVGSTIKDDAEILLSDVLSNEGDSMFYDYDLDNNWRHSVILERIIHRPAEVGEHFVAHCTGGRRACPPENMGGMKSYSDVVDCMEDPEHPDRAECIELIGCDFDTNSFDARLVNIGLEELSFSQDIFDPDLLDRDDF